MGIDWDKTLKEWAEAVDQDKLARGKRTYDAIKDAIQESEDLKGKQVTTTLAGSHRTHTNTRKGSDIDVIVTCHSVMFYDLLGGLTKKDVGLGEDSDYTLGKLRDDVGKALEAKFSKTRIARGNKAFRIAGMSTDLDADVPVFFEYRRYKNEKDTQERYKYDEGIALRPANAPSKRIISWPEQRFAAMEKRNGETNSNFVRHVRILKRLRDDMIGSGIKEQKSAADPVPSYLIESLLVNAPNHLFTLENGAYTKSVRAILAHLIAATKAGADASKLIEMSGMQPLFGDHQRWSREMAYAFVAWALERLKA